MHLFLYIIIIISILWLPHLPLPVFFTRDFLLKKYVNSKYTSMFSSSCIIFFELNYYIF